MYILFNTYKASCLNVGSDMEKALTVGFRVL